MRLEYKQGDLKTLWVKAVLTERTMEINVISGVIFGYVLYQGPLHCLTSEFL